MSIGYPTNRYKLLGFVISACVVGIAGVLSVMNHRFASADPLDVAFSGELLAPITTIANVLNVRAHRKNVSWRLPLQSIDRIQVKFGYVTRIVEVRIKDGATFAFRCFAARAFARKSKL